MTRIALQFLESAWPEATPHTVRERLRQACGILPVESVLLGWDLPPALEEAVAAEANRQGAALYRWHPLLASDSGAPLPSEWQTSGQTGAPIPGFLNLPEFTFICPNKPAAQEWIQQRIDKAAQRGIYQGIFFDRMRWPSPAEHLGEYFGCFCPYCQTLAIRSGLDLEPIRRYLHQSLADGAGAQRLIRALFAPQNETGPLEGFFRFRTACITRTVAACAQQSRASGLAVGLDCFSPGLARMVGQDLASLGQHCDWMKLMTYPRTFGPAGIPYELHSLAGWLGENYGLSKPDGLQFVIDSSRLQPGQPSTLQQEISDGKSITAAPIFAGLALVEMEKVNEASDEQVQADLLSCKASNPDGLALSWDLWLIPPRRLELTAKIFFP